MKKRKKRVAVVHCLGGSTLKEGVSRDDLPGNCAEILEKNPEGISECRYGCLGGGSCVAACRLKAVTITEKGAASIDRDKCVGCGLCVKVCPQGIIGFVLPEDTISPKCSNKDAGAAARKACESGCIGCGICEKNCPAGAITVEDHCAVINQDRCIACGMCAVKCPRGVIVDANGIFTAGA
jgi:ferredoxin